MMPKPLIKVGDVVQGMMWINRLVGVVESVKDGLAIVDGYDLFGPIRMQCPVWALENRSDDWVLVDRMGLWRQNKYKTEAPSGRDHAPSRLDWMYD
jgi:hypothetical protein